MIAGLGGQGGTVSIDGAFHGLAAFSSAFLNASEQLFLLAFDVLKVVVGELGPLLLEVAFDDVPVAFDFEFCHRAYSRPATWPNQTLVGIEVVNRVSCQILESKPSKGQRSNYAAVRTWVDPYHNVPVRIEKYNAAGQVMRRIDSGRIVTDDIGRHVPTGLTVTDPAKGTSTELDGSKLKHDVNFTAEEFTPEGLQPRSESR